jgi:hypothetical protein
MIRRYSEPPGWSVRRRLDAAPPPLAVRALYVVLLVAVLWAVGQAAAAAWRWGWGLAERWGL